MNIRQAILAAADRIEANPGVFDFWARRVPDCGMSGCALGWIGYFAGMKRGSTYNATVSEAAFGVGSGVFYDRLSALGNYDWTENAADCAKTLRLYADKYHPAEEYPSIRAALDRIFKVVTC